MKNSLILPSFLLVLALMSFTNEFEKQDQFSKETSLLVAVNVNDSIDANTVMHKENAHACYYHDKFTGRKTASGSIFNNNDLTCAHKTLPFGSKLKVTSIKTGKSVQVVVTDRGPFSKDKDIDLSKKAFMKIAPSKYGGHIRVNIEIIK